MSLLLIRHGSAGDPYRWVGEDVDRPLDARGAAQAGRLDDLVSALFADRPPTRVLSSRAVRCLQTVGPLCTRLGILPEVVDHLFEGASRNTTTLIRDLAADPETSPTVLCSHSDQRWPGMRLRLHVGADDRRWSDRPRPLPPHPLSRGAR